MIPGLILALVPGLILVVIPGLIPGLTPDLAQGGMAPGPVPALGQAASSSRRKPTFSPTW